VLQLCALYANRLANQHAARADDRPGAKTRDLSLILQFCACRGNTFALRCATRSWNAEIHSDMIGSVN